MKKKRNQTNYAEHPVAPWSCDRVFARASGEPKTLSPYARVTKLLLPWRTTKAPCHFSHHFLENMLKVKILFFSK